MVAALVVLVLVLPFVELFVFIKVAGAITFFGALAAVILVGIVGTWLAKREGLGVLRRARRRLDAGQLPADEAVNGILLLVAGLLLVLPGFVSDVVGIALLLPPVRLLARRVLFRRFEQRVRTAFDGPAGTAAGAAFAGRRMAGRVRIGSASYGQPFDVSEVPPGDGGPRPPAGS